MFIHKFMQKTAKSRCKQSFIYKYQKMQNKNYVYDL